LVARAKVYCRYNGDCKHTQVETESKASTINHHFSKGVRKRENYICHEILIRLQKLSSPNQSIYNSEGNMDSIPNEVITRNVLQTLY
jgi:hypothetical protein